MKDTATKRDVLACETAPAPDRAGDGPARLKNRRKRWRVALSYALLVLVALVILAPLLWAALASVKTLDDVYRYPPTLWPDPPRVENFADATTRLPFWRFMLNSFILATATSIGTVVTCSMAGYSFALLRWRGRHAWFLIALATLMLPYQVLLIPQFLLFTSLGWVNTYKPLIVPAWLATSGFYVFLFRQFFRSIPRDYLETARMDGVSHGEIYARVCLPIARPAVATVAVMSFLHSWHDLLGPLIYLSDFQTYPLSLGLRMYQTMEGSWVNLLMAASLVAMLPLAVLFFFTQKHITRGLLLTGPRA